MLYVIQKGYNNVIRPFDGAEIIYLVCNLVDLYYEGYPFIFSDGHAKNSYTKFFDHTHFPNIETILDYNAIKADYWSNSDNLDLKRKKQAEVLFEKEIPIEKIKGYICYNNLARKKLIDFGIKQSKIKISKVDYY